MAGPVQQRVVTRPRTDTVVRTETAERLTTVTMPGAPRRSHEKSRFRHKP